MERGTCGGGRRFQHDLVEVMEILQHPAQLKEAVKQLYQKHVTGEVKACGLEEDVQAELDRQRHYLERTVETMKSKLQKDIQQHQQDTRRLMQVPSFPPPLPPPPISGPRGHLQLFPPYPLDLGGNSHNSIHLQAGLDPRLMPLASQTKVTPMSKSRHDSLAKRGLASSLAWAKAVAMSPCSPQSQGSSAYPNWSVPSARLQ